MATNRHGDQARDRGDIISDLQHTLWALQGLGEVMDPDNHLEGQPRANLSFLISILTERFETLIDEAEHRWHSPTVPVAAPTQEGESHGHA